MSDTNTDTDTDTEKKHNYEDEINLLKLQQKLQTKLRIFCVATPCNQFNIFSVFLEKLENKYMNNDFIHKIKDGLNYLTGVRKYNYICIKSKTDIVNQYIENLYICNVKNTELLKELISFLC